MHQRRETFTGIQSIFCTILYDLMQQKLNFWVSIAPNKCACQNHYSKHENFCSREQAWIEYVKARDIYFDSIYTVEKFEKFEKERPKSWQKISENVHTIH